MRDFTRIPIRLDRLVKIDKAALGNALFCAGMSLCFLLSLHPWFLWNVELIADVLVCACLLGTVLVQATMMNKPVTNGQVLIPTLCYALLTLCIFFVNGGNFFGFLRVGVYVVTYYSLFRADGTLMKRALVFTSKALAVLLSVSLFFFMLYLTGRSMPYSSVVYGDNLYSFMNYRFFLVADNDMWTLIPRFQSVFLEPSHIAIACVFLLMTDVGQWQKKWYNIVLLVVVLVSFSLEAYVLLFCLFFFSRWIMRKHFVRNLIGLAVVFSGIIVGSFFYNDGDNLLNTLIVARLEVDDGEVAGNNRTTDSFDAEFDSFMNSSDILVGRDLAEGFGNSGYKVFIYDNGVVALCLLFLFYGVLLYNPRNKRAALTACSLAFIHFIVRAHMTWSSCILPMYFMAQWYEQPKSTTDEP